ncbi:MAG: hypothetical protein JWM89_1720 [Acidimicrobiales bacterium]|nr:hypothetical protein [Acidimicrobiales bacterium]
MRRFYPFAAVLIPAIGLAWSTPAIAQSGGSTTTTTAPAGGASSAITLTQGRQVSLAIIALGFGVLAIAAVLVFLARDRARSFRELARLTKLGKGATAEDEAPFAELTTLADEGPDILAPKQAKVGEATSLAITGVHDGDTVAWAVTGDGTLTSATGPTTSITITRPGVVRVTATLTPAGEGATSPASRTADITATSAEAQAAATVPFLGKGYGSVVLGLAIVSVTAALGLTAVIEGESVAAILGALVSYSVARGIQAGGANPSAAPGAGP